MKTALSWIASAALAFTLTACSTTPQTEQMPGEMEGGGARTGQAGSDNGAFGESQGPASAGAASGSEIQGENLPINSIESGPLSQRVIYFQFDSSDIQSQYSDILQAHGEYLATHPEVSVTVEGHTDERGSREYNLALGERRAHAVVQLLTLNGAANDQVQTVSYGEEQPATMGHDESAWSKNRRAELVYEQ